tara:strand:- start:301 stop:612 length:312 start_codon:yes stop_codon:yes gene_type:complete
MLLSIVLLLIATGLVASASAVLTFVYLTRKEEDEFEALELRIEELTRRRDALLARLSYLSEFDDTDKEEFFEVLRNPYNDPIGRKHKEELAGLLNTQIGDFAS